MIEHAISNAAAWSAFAELLKSAAEFALVVGLIVYVIKRVR